MVLVGVALLAKAPGRFVHQIKVVGDINLLMGSQPAHRVEILQPVRIKHDKVTLVALLTYQDGRAERCSFEMELTQGTGVSIDGITLSPRYRQCMAPN